jgi:hypothetical protein
VKKRHIFLVIFILSLAFFIFDSEETPVETGQKIKSEKVSEKKRIPTSTEDQKSSPVSLQKKPLPLIVNKKIPTLAPRELKERWSHQSNFEDDAYIDTQLHLDGKPLEGYFFKWSKNEQGEASELISGAMPNIERVDGAFPNSSELQQIVNTTLDPDTEVLSTQEVWHLNSSRVLTPQAKVEVKTKSRSQRSSGHEYWFISLNTGKILKRVEADRF